MTGSKSTSSSQASSQASSTQSTPSTPQTLSLSPAEIAKLTAALNALRPQIPQIDKVIQLHNKSPTAPEVLKKLIELRNVLVNQIEMAAVKKAFFLNHAQLSLLTDQIQKLSSHLNSRLKESNSSGSIASNHSNNSNNSNNSNSNHNGNVNGNNPVEVPAKSQASTFERNLAQKLSLPFDDFSASPADSHGVRFLNFPVGTAADLRHLSMRNRFLEAECQRLEQEEGFRILRHDEAFGRISLLASHPKTKTLVSFLLPSLYPQTELLYRIEGDEKLVNGLLPDKYEPQHAPFTISTILRRYQQIKKK